MRYLDICSGISAPTMAWKPLGWKALCFAEIEPFPRAVLSHHYPDVPLNGDFTQIEGTEYGPVDLLVGGTPCQSFSVAGLRGGLADERGNLALEYLRLADRARPRWVVWENVPGVFSSLSHDAPDCRPPDIDLDSSDAPQDGEEVVVEDRYDADESHALACFLAGLSELGYGWAYRVFDAQYAGVPQRRRRIFVVGHLGSRQRAAAVLFERHSLQGHSPPRREKGQAAPTIPSRSTAGGGLGTDFDCDGGLIHVGPRNLHRPVARGHLEPSTGEVSHCLNAGGMGRQDYETETLIAHSLRAEGFDASEDGTGRGTPLVPVIADTLTSNGDAHSGFRDEKGLVPVHVGGGSFPTVDDEGGVPTLTGRNGDQSGVMLGSSVRRLTPRECERLQGFPDDFTLVPYRGKPAADGPRYRALGNSMAVPVIAWLGQRIQLVDSIQSADQIQPLHPRVTDTPPSPANDAPARVRKAS